MHAYAGEPGEVRVDADVEDEELELVVTDDGRGFTPGPAPGLGLGLGLIRASAAAFEIRDRPLGGVEVWMRFPLGSGAAGRRPPDPRSAAPGPRPGPERRRRSGITRSASAVPIGSPVSTSVRSAQERPADGEIG